MGDRPEMSRATVDQPALGAPRWERDGQDWPHHEASRFVYAGGLRWHVQVLGSGGPPLLLVHGTGAATHSWRDLAPELAKSFTVVMPDLPGHGFTEMPEPRGLSLPGMADGLAALARKLECRPTIAIGHSAGAAILARMVLDGAIAPQLLVSLNGALLPLRGVPGHLFSPMAKLLASSTLVPRFFAWRANDRKVIERMLRATGSDVTPTAIELYGRLVRNPGHAAAALGMMANWDLRPLARDLPRLEAPLALIVGTNDHTVPPAEARRVRALLPRANLIALNGLGHLAHEECPEEVAALIVRLARQGGLLPERRAA